MNPTNHQNVLSALESLLATAAQAITPQNEVVGVDLALGALALDLFGRLFQHHKQTIAAAAKAAA